MPEKPVGLHPEAKMMWQQWVHSSKEASRMFADNYGVVEQAQLTVARDTLAADHRSIMKLMGVDWDDDDQLRAIASVFADVLYGAMKAKPRLAEMGLIDEDTHPAVQNLSALGYCFSVLVDGVMSACNLKGWLDETDEG